ncbi:hypothetical protein PV379_01625 [Streptomyces caniscabiei]|nr:hypothetical protein [Streptomyces caniscabiei]MDX2776053.1 hypothetical protein [Streptomyces caniscabiei]
MRQTESGLTVVEKGPLVTPEPKGFVVVVTPQEAPKPLLGADGQPISSES